MAKVILESWNEGLQKVSLTKLQVEKLGLSLKESKGNVDLLMDDKIVILEIKDNNLATCFLRESEKMGVNGKIIFEDLSSYERDAEN
jgi:hypothetical protein